MKKKFPTELSMIILGVLIIGVYISIYDDFQQSKREFGKYIAIMSALGFPAIIFFRKWKTTEKEGKAKKLSKADREVFSKIEATPNKYKKVWPVGYGYNARESTDEVIDRFITPEKLGKDSTGEFDEVIQAPNKVKTPKSFAPESDDDESKENKK